MLMVSLSEVRVMSAPLTVFVLLCLAGALLLAGLCLPASYLSVLVFHPAAAVLSVCSTLTWLVCGLFQCEEAAYEERRYPAGKWACVTKGEPMYEQSISMSFMKLMRYICKENSVGVCRQGLEGLADCTEGRALPLSIWSREELCCCC